MVVRTTRPRSARARKVLYELMLSDHPTDCLHCARSHDCEFRQLGEVLQSTSPFAGQRSKNLVDTSSALLCATSTSASCAGAAWRWATSARVSAP
jgi:NADH dehydrogenase/NADH:ubiquinone oxidoreductase subunit G